MERAALPVVPGGTLGQDCGRGGIERRCSYLHSVVQIDLTEHSMRRACLEKRGSGDSQGAQSVKNLRGAGRPQSALVRPGSVNPAFGIGNRNGACLSGKRIDRGPGADNHPHKWPSRDPAPYGKSEGGN
jgi:hypothetical protein